MNDILGHTLQELLPEEQAQQAFRQLEVLVTDFAMAMPQTMVAALPNVDIEITLRLLLRR